MTKGMSGGLLYFSYLPSLFYCISAQRLLPLTRKARDDTDVIQACLSFSRGTKCLMLLTRVLTPSV